MLQKCFAASTPAAIRCGRSHGGAESIVTEITEAEKVPCSNAGEFGRSGSYALPTNHRAEAF
jgi:hypothetical protein